MAIMKSLHTTLRTLRPPEIDDLGLAASLSALAVEHERRAGGGLQITVEINGDLQALPPTAALHVYGPDAGTSMRCSTRGCLGYTYLSAKLQNGAPTLTFTGCSRTPEPEHVCWSLWRLVRRPTPRQARAALGLVRRRAMAGCDLVGPGADGDRRSCASSPGSPDERTRSTSTTCPILMVCPDRLCSPSSLAASWRCSRQEIVGRRSCSSPPRHSHIGSSILSGTQPICRSTTMRPRLVSNYGATLLLVFRWSSSFWGSAHGSMHARRHLRALKVSMCFGAS